MRILLILTYASLVHWVVYVTPTSLDTENVVKNHFFKMKFMFWLVLVEICCVVYRI